MEAGLTGYNMDKYRAAKRIIISVLADSTGPDNSKYRLWLSKKGSVESAYHEAGTYIMTGDYGTARKVRDSIPNNFSLDSNDMIEHNHFVTLTELVIGAMEGGRHYTAYGPSLVAQVQAVADNSSGIAGTMSQGLLNVFYGYEYMSDPKPVPLPPSELRSPPVQGNASSADESYQPLKAFPNPATDRVLFQYDLGEGNISGKVEVFDVNGQLVRSFNVIGQKGKIEWDTAPYDRGIYYCRTSGMPKNSVPLRLVLLKQ